MAVRPTVLDGNLTVADFVARLALTQPFSTYPLVDPEGRLTGLVTLNRARAVPAELRATTHLREIACAPAEVRSRVRRILSSSFWSGCTAAPTVALLSSMTPAESWAWCPAATSHVRWSWLDLRGFDPYPAHSGADMTSLSSQWITPPSLIRSIRRRQKGGLRGQNDHGCFAGSCARLPTWLARRNGATAGPLVPARTNPRYFAYRARRKRRDERPVYLDGLHVNNNFTTG